MDEFDIGDNMMMDNEDEYYDDNADDDDLQEDYAEAEGEEAEGVEGEEGEEEEEEDDENEEENNVDEMDNKEPAIMDKEIDQHPEDEAFYPLSSDLKQILNSRAIILSYFRFYGFVRAQLDSFNKYAKFTMPSIMKEAGVVIVECKTVNEKHVFTFFRPKFMLPSIQEHNGVNRHITPAECRLRSLNYSSRVLSDIRHDKYDLSKLPRTNQPKQLISELMEEPQPDEEKYGGKCVESRVYREVALFKQLIMLKSDYCVLKQFGITEGECPDDPGGYFIVKGAEKVIVAQENLRSNFVYISRVKKQQQKYAYQGEIRSLNENKVRSTSTLKFYVTKSRGVMPKVVYVIPFIKCEIPVSVVFRFLGVRDKNEMIRYIIGSRKSKQEYAELLRHVECITDPTYRQEYSMNDDDVFELIGTLGTPEKTRDKKIKYVKHILANEFLPHIGLEKSEAIRKKRCFFLGHTTRRILLAYLKNMEEDDRDHYKVKRLQTCGTLFALQFRQKFRVLQKGLSMIVHRAAENKKYFNVVDCLNYEKMTNDLRYAIATGNWAASAGGGFSSTGVSQQAQRFNKWTFISHLRRLSTPINRQGKSTQVRLLHLGNYRLICPIETPEGSSCLKEGTPISLANGTSIPIEQVTNQHELLCFDINTKKIVSAFSATPKAIDNGMKECLEITFEDGRTIIATFDHRFLIIHSATLTFEWKECKDLLGLRVVCSNTSELLSVTATRLKSVGLKQVYDLSVPNYNNYVANGMVVHNCGLLKNLALFTHIRNGHPSTVLEKIISLCFHMIPLLEIENTIHTQQSLVFLNGSPIGFVQNGKLVLEKLRQMRLNQDIPFDISLYPSDATYNEINVDSDPGALLSPLYVVSNLYKLEKIFPLYQHDLSQLWPELMNEGIIEFIDKNEEDWCEIAMYPQEITAKTRYLEITSFAIFSPNTLCVIMADRNQAPRNIFCDQMLRAAMNFPMFNYMDRFDTTVHVLNYPQKALVGTITEGFFPLSEDCHLGSNPVIGIICAGWVKEDAIILKKEAVERGLFDITILKSYRDVERVGPNETECFEKIHEEDKETMMGIQDANYDRSDENGLPKEGDTMEYKDVLFSKVHRNVPTSTTTPSSLPLTTATTNESSKPHDRSIIYKGKTPAKVDRVIKTTTKKGMMCVRARIREHRSIKPGDKLASRQAQKGVVAVLMSEVDMPFDPVTGMIPDLLIDPAAITSRMTLSLIWEIIFGLKASFDGKRVDGTPFSQFATTYSDKVLTDNGYAKTGKRVLCRGDTGQMMQCQTYMGPAQYMRLKHQADDKIHVRAHGAVQAINRQPTEGRNKNGGLRFGEMESQALQGHGVAFTNKDRLLDCSDPFPVDIHVPCGWISEPPKPKRYQTTINSHKPYCRSCKSYENHRRIILPFATILLIRELAACQVSVHLKL